MTGIEIHRTNSQNQPNIIIEDGMLFKVCYFTYSSGTILSRFCKVHFKSLLDFVKKHIK